MYKASLAAAAALAILAGPASAVTMAGKTVDIQYLYPKQDTVAAAGGGTGNFTVGAGPETIVGNILKVDISSDNLLTLTAVKPYAINETETFQGIRISDAFDSIGNFTGFTQVGASTFLNTVGLLFDEENLYVNFVGENDVRAGDLFQARIDVAPVPLPAAAALLVAGIAGIRVVSARGRRKLEGAA